MNAASQVQAPRSAASTASRYWHGLIAIVIVVSLTIQLVLLFAGGADANSGETGGSTSVGVRLWRLFSYFTGPPLRNFYAVVTFQPVVRLAG